LTKFDKLCKKFSTWESLREQVEKEREKQQRPQRQQIQTVIPRASVPRVAIVAQKRTAIQTTQVTQKWTKRSEETTSESEESEESEEELPKNIDMNLMTELFREFMIYLEETGRLSSMAIHE